MDTQADWDRMHRVNAKGVFFCLQTVEPGWSAHRLDRRQGLRGCVESAGKGAVIGVTTTAAQQRAALSDALAHAP